MTSPWQRIEVSLSGTITVGTYDTVYRLDLPEETELTWDQLDDREKAGRINNYEIEAFGGTTPSDMVITQILGGNEGFIFNVRLVNEADSALFVYDATKINSSIEDDIYMSDRRHMVQFINYGGGVYVPTTFF